MLKQIDKVIKNGADIPRQIPAVEKALKFVLNGIQRLIGARDDHDIELFMKNYI